MGEPSLLRPLYKTLYDDLVRRALAEDLGGAGDITTDAVVSPEMGASAQIIAKRPGRLAGLDVALAAFTCLDSSLIVQSCRCDGSDISEGEPLARLQGAARPILSAERTALNFLGRMSGIATATRGIVKAVSKSKCRVVCTRKTTPGLRALEKYAVRAGGGYNHRFGLDDAVLIKDNHKAMAGGVEEAVRRARASVGHMVKIQVEADSIEELRQALALGVDAILLDNMSLAELAEAVRLSKGKALMEASGGITPENAAEIASTGVDLISVGWLTHSAPALDVSLEVSPL